MARNAARGERRDGALLAVAALLLALVLLGGPPALAEEEGLAAVSLPSALDDFGVAQLEAVVPGAGAADGVPEVVTEGLPAVVAVANPRYEEEEAEALRSATRTGVNLPSARGSARNHPSEWGYETSLASLAPPREPPAGSSLIDDALEDTETEVVVYCALFPPPSPPSWATFINAEQAEPLPPSSLNEQAADTHASCGPLEAQEHAPCPDASVQESPAAVIPESCLDETVSHEPTTDLPNQVGELSAGGAGVDRDDGSLTAPEKDATPLPSDPDLSETRGGEAELSPSTEAIELAEGTNDADAPAAEDDAKEEVETSSVEQAEAEGTRGSGAKGEIDGEAESDDEREVNGIAACEGAYPVADAQLAAFEEAVSSAREAPAGLVPESGRFASPPDPRETRNEGEVGQGEGLVARPDLYEDAEKTRPTASDGELGTPQISVADEGKATEEDELHKKLEQESLMAARKKRLREQAVNQTAEEEERAREVVRRKLESLLQRDQTKRPSEPSSSGESVLEGGGVKPSAVRSAPVGRASDGAKAETRSPAASVASPSAKATTKKSLPKSSSPSAVVSPSHPAYGLPKANPTRLEPPSHLAGAARTGQRPSYAGPKRAEHVKADEDEYEDDGGGEDDGLFEEDYLAALVGRSQPETDHSPDARSPNDLAGKARKLVERKMLLKMASGVSHSVSEDPDLTAWKRRAKLRSIESRRKQDVPTYDITNAAARRRELERVKKEKQKNKGSLRYKKAA